jgi:hypothetical protein
VERVASVFYTQQVNVLVNDFSAGVAKPFLIIGGNIVVLAGFFVWVYWKKGLRA